MKKFLGVIFFLVLGFAGFAKQPGYEQAAAKLERALLDKDTVVLKQLLHKELTYGHSNGWIQLKKEVLEDLASGKLSYERMVSRDVKWITVNNVATMRCASAVDYRLNDEAGELNLNVLQVWIKTDQGWQLLARQSVKK